MLMLGSQSFSVLSVTGARAATPVPRAKGSLVVSLLFLFFFFATLAEMKPKGPTLSFMF